MPRQPRVPKTPRKELTLTERSEIIGAYRLGHSPVEITKQFGHKRTTMYETIALASERQNNVLKPRGRPRKTTAKTDELIAEAAMVAPTRPLRELH